MTEVASRELRNNTRSVLSRVESGEEIIITVDGRAAAVLRPVTGQSRWMSRQAFAGRLAGHQADPGLFAELRSLLPDTTDHLNP